VSPATTATPYPVTVDDTEDKHKHNTHRPNRVPIINTPRGYSERQTDTPGG